MNNVHIVIDLETWGNTPGSALRSIGAVAFDPYTGTIWSQFYVNVADTDEVLTKDPATVDWWSGQPEAAQAVFNDPKYGRYDPPVAFEELVTWAVNLGVPNDVQVWAHGGSYDVPHLIAAFAAHGVSWPFHYRAPRDTRTLFEVAGWDVAKCLNDFADPNGIYHFALDDAKCEARAISAAYRVLGITRPGETPAAMISALRALRDDLFVANNRYQQDARDARAELAMISDGWHVIEATDEGFTARDADGREVIVTFGDPPATQIRGVFASSQHIVVYVIPEDEFECKPCNELKAMLDAAGLEYDVRPIRVEKRGEWYKLENIPVGERYMPQMFVNDMRIGGRDNARKWLAEPR